jgi:hypothetical protein
VGEGAVDRGRGGQEWVGRERGMSGQQHLMTRYPHWSGV